TVRLLRAADGTPEFEVVGAAGATARYPVSHSYGAGHGRFKQRYMTRIDGTLRVSPLQYNEATGEWVAYHLERWIDAAGALQQPSATQTFETGCQGCHSTGLQLEPGEDDVVRAAYTELNTGCEACHGPASKHVLAPRGDNIINPRRLYPAGTFGIIGMDGQVAQAEAWAGFQRAQEACGKCHVRGHSKTAAGAAGAFEFPWVEARGAHGQVQVGEPLADGFVPGDGLWDDTRYDRTASSKQHHQQYTDELNGHLTGAGHGRNPFHLVACFDCHDPHGGPLDSQLRLPANDNTLCLDCHGPHGFEDQAAIIGHTGHARHNPETTGSGRCVGCHMPRTAKSAVNYDIRSHSFRVVVPHESTAQVAEGAPVMPNSCDVCHVDDADRGANRYEIFFDAPERVED
ncbi:MAG: hypothetical protein KC613_13505, partial [Myxococcales bacterium]|nr:hypothetical protein [Myxococcales bacterium]